MHNHILYWKDLCKSAIPIWCRVWFKYINSCLLILFIGVFTHSQIYLDLKRNCCWLVSIMFVRICVLFFYLCRNSLSKILNLPWVGIISLQGSANGIMVCWYTNAERLPVIKNKWMRFVQSVLNISICHIITSHPTLHV